METRRLRAFIEIVNVGSLTRAAANLGIAQPALSQQLSDMEHHFGVTLFVRSHRGVQPTAAGMALYRHSQMILRQLEQAEREVASEDKTLTGKVVIGMLYSTAPALLVPLIRRVLDDHPLINLRVIEGMSGALIESTSKCDLDFSILSIDGNPHGLECKPLISEKLFFISSAANQSPSAGNSIKLKQLENSWLVLPTRGHHLRNLIDQVLIRHDVKINVVAEIDSLTGLAAAATSGIANTILPAVALSGIRHMLRMQPIINPAVERDIALCVSKSFPLLPAAQAVHNTLNELVKQLVVTGAWPDSRVL